MAVSPALAEFRYRAFIAYSHQDEDWAKWLHKALETYRVPRRLVGTETAIGVIPRRLAPIFRDRSELPSAADLSQEINEALSQSANLIVICSSHSATSRYVNEEVSTFKRLEKADRIFCLIVGGEPQASTHPGHEAAECFAPALRFKFDPDGQPTPDLAAPLAADARAGKDSKSNAKLKLIAGILGVGFDALKQREHQRNVQRLVTVTALSLIAMLITAGLAVDAMIARQAAERRQKSAEALIAFMLGDLNDKLRQVQRLDILESVNDQAMAYFLSLPTRDVTDQALALRVDALLNIGQVRSDQGNLPAALESHRAASLLAAELLRRAPGDPEREAAYARTLNFIGRTYWYQGDFTHALENFQQAIALLEQTTIAGAPDARLVSLASARTNAGRVLEARGDLSGAKALYEKVLKTFKTLTSRQAGDVRWQPELADAYDSLGKLALEQGQLTQAISAYRHVRQIRGQLSTRSPGDRSAQEDLVLSDAILGRALALCGADDASVHYVSEAVNTARALVAYDGTYTDWREELAEYSRLLGSLLRSQSRFEESAARDREALRILMELVATDKTNATWRRELAITQVELARLSLARGDLIQAEPLLDTALSTIAGDRAKSPEDRSLRLLESQAQIVSGEVAAQRHDEATARGQWMRARDAMATSAQVGADPNFIATWASALLLLDDTDGARPALDQLASMGYKTRDFDTLVVSKRQSYPLKAAAQRCGGDGSELTAGFQMP